ncbi:MAG: 2,4-dihydroxyhept-2-ene-1,7-dioic acid aldolase [Alphaproteobacteria bacterium]|nr:MAG: 2,4-dihydroxyhept-2-ene-1,7-dioic acid aldolase [Alphaproteobacteria bacterium]
MRENRLRALWRDGGAAINGWLSIPSSISAETMAHQDWDSLTIDMQHGVIDYQVAVTMLQAISTTDVMPMARVPWLDPGYIMRMLDAGAYGIICPMINTRAEAEAFVGACRYAPQGYRSFAPLRALMYAGPDYPERANDTVLAFAMIETRTALDNLDDILSVPGLDGIYIGPSDLGLSLGGAPKLDQTDSHILAAIETILAAAQRHGIIPGIHCLTPAYARRMVDLGFRLVTISSDNGLLARITADSVAEVRRSMAGKAD